MSCYEPKFYFASAWLPWWVAGVCLSFLLPKPWILFWLMAACLLGLLAIWQNCRWSRHCCFLCIGVLFALWRTDLVLQKQWPIMDKAQLQQVELTVIDIAQIDQYRSRFQAQVKLADGSEQNWLVTDYAKQDWPAGSRWRVKAKVKAIIGETNSVGFNREAWALSNHIGAVATLKGKREKLSEKNNWGSRLSRWRALLGNRWHEQAHAYPQGVALLKALAVGEQSALPAEAWQIFRPLGLNHLVSISGLHVGMLAMLVSWLFGKLLLYFPIRLQQPWVCIRIVAVFTAVVYSALAGFAVPTQRSMLMIIILALTWRRGRLSSFQVWWLTVSIVLLFDPLAVLSVGFWLSFLLVAALMWNGEGSGRLSQWKQLFQSQWAAGIASVVLVAYSFGSVPLMSPPVNAIAIPWFTLVLVPLSLVSLILPFPFLCTLAAWSAEQTMQFLHIAASYAPEYYPAHAPVGLWLLSIIAVILLLLPRGWYLRPLCVLILALLLAYRPPRPLLNEARVIVWDVGQGLSVSISTANHDLLFDTGTAFAAQSVLLPNLKAIGINNLNALVLSHNDTDHDGGSTLIRNSLQPKQIFAGQVDAYKFSVLPCRAGINWEWDGVWFEFLNQPVSSNAKKNDHSCVLRVVTAGKSVLITGDLAKKGERILQEIYGDKLFSQILLLGHHGSHSSSDTAFIRTVAPEYAVASAGFANSYNHPHIKVQELLKQENIALLRTDSMGGMQTTLSEKPIRWQLLLHFQPYWQRKPFEKPIEYQ